MKPNCVVDGCDREGSSCGECKMHYNRWYRGSTDLTVARGSGCSPTPPQERFWAKVNKDGPVPEHCPDLGPCWLWMAARRWNGYGHFAQQVAHKVSYEWLVGPVPDGLQLDHLCRVRFCVNPSHLEAVTQQVNIARGEGPSALNASKTHCPKMHEYTPENTRVKKGRRAGAVSRDCKTCHRERERAAKARRKKRTIVAKQAA